MLRVNYTHQEQPLIKSEIKNAFVLDDPADDKTKNLILAMTPDGKVVGVKFAWDRPDFFEDDSNRDLWMKKAFDRVERVRKEINEGYPLESYGDMLDTEPEVTDKMRVEMQKNRQYG